MGRPFLRTALFLFNIPRYTKGMAKTSTKKTAKSSSATIGFEDDPDAYLADNIFFVPPEARWSEIAKAAHTPEIGAILDKTMIAIEADNMGHMVDRKHRDFSEEDIARLADTFTAFQNGTLEDVKGFCAVATTKQIAAQDYILTPGRYVGIEEKAEDDEPFADKMTRLTTELGGMFAKSHELEEEIKKNLEGIGFKI